MVSVSDRVGTGSVTDQPSLFGSAFLDVALDVQMMPGAWRAVFATAFLSQLCGDLCCSSVIADNVLFVALGDAVSATERRTGVKLNAGLGRSAARSAAPALPR